jgi:hypothetical protein
MGRCLSEVNAGDRTRPHLEAALALFEKAEARTLVQRVAPFLRQ